MGFCLFCIFSLFLTFLIELESPSLITEESVFQAFCVRIRTRITTPFSFHAFPFLSVFYVTFVTQFFAIPPALQVDLSIPPPLSPYRFFENPSFPVSGNCVKNRFLPGFARNHMLKFGFPPLLLAKRPPLFRRYAQYETHAVVSQQHQLINPYDCLPFQSPHTL